MTWWSLNDLLLCLLCVLYGLLYRWVLCPLYGLSTELSTFKMKATLANMNPTASATSLYKLSCISDCLCYLCLSECPLSLLGGYLLALATGYLCQHGRTFVPVTWSTTNILAANHTDQPLGLRKP
jgi:hypothetical protein